MNWGEDTNLQPDTSPAPQPQGPLCVFVEKTRAEISSWRLITPGITLLSARFSLLCQRRAIDRKLKDVPEKVTDNRPLISSRGKEPVIPLGPRMGVQPEASRMPRQRGWAGCPWLGTFRRPCLPPLSSLWPLAVTLVSPARSRVPPGL